VDLEPASIAQVKMMKDGRVLEIDDDVSGIAKQLAEIHPSLKLRWSEPGEYFVVFQETEEGRHLVTTSLTCDQRLVDRLREVTAEGYDLAYEIEKREAEAKAVHEAKISDQVGEVGERLAHAIRADLGERKPDYVRFSDRKK